MAAPPTKNVQPAAAVHITQDVRLEDIISQSNPGFLRPLCFFVSWQGVMTLAYSGFPDSLLALKAQAAEQFPGLPKENPGSLWPKTTLGALRDKRRLTREELKGLVSMCKEESKALIEFLQTEETMLKVPVRSAAVAVFLCRSLEKLLSFKEVFLEGPPPPPVHQMESVGLEDEDLGCEESEMEDADDEEDEEEEDQEEEVEAPKPTIQDGLAAVLAPKTRFKDVDAVDREIGVSAAEKARVQKIVAECDSEDYWFAASKDGSREAHYREPALGCTLMIPFGQYVAEDREYGPKELFAFITMFQERVDAKYPGLYKWLDLKAAHVTLRGIMG